MFIYKYTNANIYINIHTYESSRYQIRRAGLLEFLYMRPEQLLVGS